MRNRVERPIARIQDRLKLLETNVGIYKEIAGIDRQRASSASTQRRDAQECIRYYQRQNLSTKSAPLPLSDLTFVLEQPALALQAASISAEAAVGADDPVTGHDDRDGIRAIRRSHRPDCPGGTDLTCDLRV